MRHTLKIIDERVRQYASSIIRDIPLDLVHEVVIREYKKNRSLESNAKMWAILTDISDQVEWYGQKLTKEEWKDVITAAVKKQKVIPGLDGGFVVLGAHTSKMSVSEMSEVIECATAFGCQQGVKWSDRGDEWQ